MGSVICPECGTPSPDTAKFCLKCGQRLVSAAPEPANQARKHGVRRAAIWAIVLAVVVLGGWAVATTFLPAGTSQPGKLGLTATLTPSATVAASKTEPQPSLTATEPLPSKTPSPLPTALALSTATPVSTMTPLATATALPTSTPPPTATPIPTSTPITPTPSPSATITPTPSLTPTRRPTAIPYCYEGRLERIEDYSYPLISIHGLVVDRKGKGVSGVIVRVSAYNWFHDVRTGWDGLFVIDGLDQAIEWTVSLPDHDASVQVPIEDGGKKGIVRFEEMPCR